MHSKCNAMFTTPCTHNLPHHLMPALDHKCRILRELTYTDRESDIYSTHLRGGSWCTTCSSRDSLCRALRIEHTVGQCLVYSQAGETFDLASSRQDAWNVKSPFATLSIVNEALLLHAI